MANEENEHDALAILRACLAEIGITDYEIRKGNVVFWRGIDIGAIPYLNSRRKNQREETVSRAISQSVLSMETKD